MKIVLFVIILITALVLNFQHSIDKYIVLTDPGIYRLTPYDYYYASSFKLLLIGGGAAGSGFPNIRTHKIECTGGGAGSLVIAHVYTNHSTFNLIVGKGGHGVIGDYGENGDDTIITNDINTVYIVAGGGYGANLCKNDTYCVHFSNNYGYGYCDYSYSIIHCYYNSVFQRLGSGLDILSLYPYDITRNCTAPLRMCGGLPNRIGYSLDELRYLSDSNKINYTPNSSQNISLPNHIQPICLCDSTSDTYFGQGGDAAGTISCCDSYYNCSTNCTYCAGCNGGDGIIIISFTYPILMSVIRIMHDVINLIY